MNIMKNDWSRIRLKFYNWIILFTPTIHYIIVYMTCNIYRYIHTVFSKNMMLIYEHTNICQLANAVNHMEGMELWQLVKFQKGGSEVKSSEIIWHVKVAMPNNYFISKLKLLLKVDPWSQDTVLWLSGLRDKGSDDY